MNVQDLNKLGHLIGDIVSNKKGSKATIKLSIEFDC